MHLCSRLSGHPPLGTEIPVPFTAAPSHPGPSHFLVGLAPRPHMLQSPQGHHPMICDICGRDVRTLAVRATSRRGLDLCQTCYRRILRQEQAQRQEKQHAYPYDDPSPGPPYEWPRCELCGDDLDSHGLGYYTVNRTRRRFCSVECRVSICARSWSSDVHP